MGFILRTKVRRVFHRRLTYNINIKSMQTLASVQQVFEGRTRDKEIGQNPVTIRWNGGEGAYSETEAIGKKERWIQG